MIPASASLARNCLYAGQSACTIWILSKISRKRFSRGCCHMLHAYTQGPCRPGLSSPVVRLAHARSRRRSPFLSQHKEMFNMQLITGKTSKRPRTARMWSRGQIRRAGAHGEREVAVRPVAFLSMPVLGDASCKFGMVSRARSSHEDCRQGFEQTSYDG